jgi:hypothetical protein
MSKLVGLAFTSPGLAVCVIDREKYRVCYHDQSTAADFRLFLQQKDDRKPVVFVTSARVLAEIQPMGEGTVESYVLFSDPAILTEIKGIHLPDITGEAAGGWTRVNITPDEFNAILDKGATETFEVTEKALTASGDLTKGITFKELVEAVEASYRELGKDSTDMVLQACRYVTKLISKKTWVSSARKPALNAGISVKVLAELEKSIETDKAAEELWRAFYELATNGTDSQKILTNYAVTKDDIDLLVNKLKPGQGQTFDFTAVPGAAKKKKKSS